MSDHPDILWRRIREAERTAPDDRPVVLVIEDDPNTRMLMRYALRNVVRTDAASTVTDAIGMAEAMPYDGLLVDIRLPDGMGTEVVDELREQTPYWGVPMVAISGYALPENEGHFLEAGFDAYLAKPFDQEDLRTLVRHLVVEPEDAVDRGRKLMRKEAAEHLPPHAANRDGSDREPPATRRLDMGVDPKADAD